MNVKKIMFFSILLLILTVGCVSATDNLTQDVSLPGDNSHDMGSRILETIDDESLGDVTYEFDVSPNPQKEIEYGRDLLLNVILPSDISGNISYTVNSKSFSIGQDRLYSDAENYGEPSIRINANDLKYGLNTLSFTYVGEDYPQKTITKSYTLESSIKLNERYVGWSDDGHVTLTLPADANGNLVIYELIFYDLPDDIWGYGARYNQIAAAPLTNGFANVSVSNLNPGRHYIYANYTGSDYRVNFEFSLNNMALEKAIYEKEYDAYFEVIPKIDLPSKIYTSNEYIIDFRLPESYNGILTVNVGNEERNFTVSNGKASFKLFNIESAGHVAGEEFDYINVKVFYNDNRYNYKFDNSYVVFVSDAQSVSEFDVINYTKKVLKGEINDISMAFPEGSSGRVDIFLDGEKIDEVSVSGDILGYDLSTQSIDLGSHKLTFQYVDDGNIVKTKSIDFEVTYIDVDYQDTIEIGPTAGGNTINVRLLDDATGSVRISIDGGTAAQGTIEDGGYIFDIRDISIGNHDIEVSYSGNYPAYSLKFTINAIPQQNIQLNDIIYGQHNNVTLELPEGSTGTATLTVGTKKFTAKINDDGEAVFDVYGLSQGSYSWTLDYQGDAVFPAYKSTGSVRVVYKIISNADYRDRVYADEDVTFTLVLPTNAKGSLVLSRYSESKGSFEIIDSTRVINGKAQIVFFNLNVGENVFKAEYSGQDYAVIAFNDSVQVINRAILPENKGILVGNPAEYEIQLEDDANTTLRVYMEIDGSYRLIQQSELINGHATVTLDNLSVGLYNLKFESGSGWSHKVYLSVDDRVSWKIIPKVKLGENNVFEARLPSNTSGTFTITVSHPEYSYSQKTLHLLTVKYDDGFVAVPSSMLYVGEYKVLNFTFNDTTYGVNEFTIPDADLAKFIIENRPSVRVSKVNSTLTIEFPKDATGEVIIPLAGRQYIRTLDMGRTVISGVDPNLESIILTYLGSKMYSQIVNGKIEVMDLNVYNASQPSHNPDTQNSSSQIRVAAKVIAKDTVVVYSAKGKYNVAVYGTDGKAAAGVYVVFKIAGKQVARIKTNSRGIASYTVNLNPGVYKLSATSLGKTVTKKLTVKHVLVLKSVKIKKSARYLVLQAALSKINGKYLVSKRIVFKFNGRNYIAKTNNYGIAKLTVKSVILKKLRVGRNVAYQATYLKDTVKKSANVLR